MEEQPVKIKYPDGSEHYAVIEIKRNAFLFQYSIIVTFVTIKSNDKI